MRAAPRANREASGNGAAASDEAPAPPTLGIGELARLRSIVAAQKWDIEGLTEQRDALLRATAERDATVEMLEERLAEQDEERAKAAVETAGLREQARRSGRVLRIAADLLTLLVKLLAAVEARERAVVFGRLLETIGLIDAAHYRGQGGLPPDLPDLAVHYLLEGEPTGRAPNPLFDTRHYAAQLSPYEEVPGGLLIHYVTAGWRRGLSPHPLFDGEWYLRRYADAGAAGINPLLHWLCLGAEAGYSPHPLFDPVYYTTRVGAGGGRSGVALVEHFLVTGGPAGLSPTPLFDPAFYASRNPDVATDGWNPLLHYLVQGDAEGRMPNIGFDPVWYRAQLGPGEGVRGCALSHFVAEGHDRGLWPGPLFDPQFYLRASPDVRRGRRNALEHYLDSGQHEPRDFHPLVDRLYFLSQTRTVRPGLDCLRMLVDEPRCRDLSPHQLFDAPWYLARYPDARESPLGAFEHFLRVGAAAGYDPHPLFSTAFYARQVDWQKRSRDPLSDYLRHGADELTAPHPLLDGKLYLERDEDLARDRPNPLAHYLRHGGRGDERRVPHLLFDPNLFLEKLGRVPERAHLLEFLLLPPADLVDPHRLFDCRYYLAQRPDVAAARINPLLHYLTAPAGEAANPHPLFDDGFYLAQRPDLAGGPVPPLLHYLTTGYAENLSPHPCFDSRYVSERSPDIVREGRVPLLDYLIHGPFREYDPAPWLDGVSYAILQQNAWPPPVNPLLHFVRHHPDFRAAAPADRVAPAPAKPLPSGSDASFSADRLRGAVRNLRAGGAKPTRGTAPVATVQDVIDGGAIARFVAAHEFHVEGSLGEAKRAGRRSEPRRVALYAIYAPAGELNASHRAMLLALREAGYRIVLINSTLERGRDLLAAARPHADLLVLRSNGGRDFASWMAAVGLFYDQIGGAEDWLFVNDSLLGPLGDLDPVWRAFAASKADMWGLTESFEQDYHLQSSFVILRRRAFQSAAFLRYLTTFGFPEIRTEIVRQGEIGFTAAMRRGGLATAVMAPYSDVAEAWLAQAPDRERWLAAVAAGRLPPRQAAIVPPQARDAFVAFAEHWFERTEHTVKRGDPLNSQHQFWDALLARFSYPFIKRDLLTLNPARVPTAIRLWDTIDPAARALVADTLRAVQVEPPVGGSVMRLAPDAPAAAPGPGRRRAPPANAAARPMRKRAEFANA